VKVPAGKLKQSLCFGLKNGAICAQMNSPVTTNGNGAHNPARKPEKNTAKTRTGPTSSGVKENQVSFKTAEGLELRGTLSRVTRAAVVFELNSPSITPRLSESLGEFKVVMQSETAYWGRAVVSNIVDAGTKIVCEATLDEKGWANTVASQPVTNEGKIADEFKAFIHEWQKLSKISPEFKVAVTDLQTFLQGLRLWLDQIELGLSARSEGKRRDLEHKVLGALQPPVMGALIPLFERFERLASQLDEESRPAYGFHAKHLLHPLVLGAPFMNRTFQKPLGYAGDYEMVNMMSRDPFQGDSLFAKILNTFFLNTPPVVAHRNRIDYLARVLTSETNRVARQGRPARVFNLGCGPAIEVQRFLASSPAGQKVEFTLLDFNDETVAYTDRVLNQIKTKHGCGSTIKIIKKSVAQLLKENAKFGRNSYDFVYCAGLFDYMPEAVCLRLMELFYELAVPGGTVLVSNVDACNPSRGWMECMVDWHLIYRNAQQMAEIIPSHLPKDIVRIFAEPTSVNIFAEIQKPENV
jgi:extracellular factor (EF) 3-hydroxypalmitic acid methyl ester biosynthesis protein